MSDTSNDFDWDIAKYISPIRALLGCQWGDVVSAPDDRSQCEDQASKIIIVHVNKDDTIGTELKLCPKHASRVTEESIPREGPIDE